MSQIYVTYFINQYDFEKLKAGKEEVFAVIEKAGPYQIQVSVPIERIKFLEVEGIGSYPVIKPVGEEVK